MDLNLKIMDFDFGEFLKPNALKAAAMVTLLIIATPLFTSQQCGGEGLTTYCAEKLGFPFSAYGFFKEGDLLTGKDINDFNKTFAFGLAGDLAFWYLAACVGVFAYGRFTGKGKLGEV